jgi:hypothetical protein
MQISTANGLLQERNQAQCIPQLLDASLQLLPLFSYFYFIFLLFSD